MKLQRSKSQNIFGGFLILLGILALTTAVSFTPVFVAKYLLPDHNITSGGVEQLDQYRSLLAFGGLLSLYFGFHLAVEDKLNLTAKTKHCLVIGSVIAICLMGAVLRIYFYGINRSLWYDEAMLALNIVNRSFAGLLKPLDWDQGAPIGFLLAEKSAISLLGSKDYILRLIPLLAGLASLPLVYLVAKKYAGQYPAFVALILFALSPRLVYYSSELKQYSTDVLAALILLLVATGILEEKSKPRAFVLLGIAGILTTWFSHPSVFVFAGVLFTAGVVFIVKRDFKRLLWLIGVGLAWGTSLGLDYFINLRYSASNIYLIQYWEGNFAPLPPWSNIKWYSDAMIRMLKDPATLPVNLITGELLILGVVSFTLRRWQSMLILLAPFGMILVASALDKYPFSGRLILFLVPFVYLFLAEGMDRFGMLLQRVNRPLAALFTAFFVLYFAAGPAVLAYNNIKYPPMGQDIKPVMSTMNENILGSDLIYVYHGAVPAYDFYAPSFNGLNGKYIVGTTARQNPIKYLEQMDQIDQMESGHRIWLVFSNNCSGCMVNEQVYILAHLDKIGLKLAEYQATDASVYLYELGQIR